MKTALKGSLKSSAQPAFKKFVFCTLGLASLLGCSSHPIAHQFPKSWSAKSRVPAAELPAGYQVKAQDFWTYSVWKDPKTNHLQALCKIKRTSEGFEIGTTDDPAGAAMMKKVSSDAERNLAQRLVTQTGLGFENGYSPYWSECETKGKDSKSKNKCDGNFTRTEEAGQFPAWDQSCDQLSQVPQPESPRAPASVQAVVPQKI